MATASSSSSSRKKWLVPLLSSLLISSFLLSSLLISSFLLSQRPKLSIGPDEPLFVESKLEAGFPAAPDRPVPRLAYLISGSAGDGARLRRTLRVLYHPANLYAVHLDLEAPARERLEMSVAVRKDRTYARFGNVRVVRKANLVTYRGPTMVASTLHAAAVLLREAAGEWDWFVNLSASDYPLVTQDDIMYTLANLPRHLNFIEHTSNIGWKEFHRARPVILDPALHSLQKSDVLWVTEKRGVPTAFKLFTGSAWMVLSHRFVEFCIWGWDNLPRKVLMYYANFLSSPEGYFHTVICNAPEFRNTTVNHDLHFVSWDNPPKQHPHVLTLRDYSRMVDSNAPFARKFGRDADGVNSVLLDRIDRELLGRDADGFVSGGWTDRSTATANASDPMSFVRSVSQLRPGPGAERMKRLITGLLSEDGKHCIRLLYVFFTSNVHMLRKHILKS